MNIADIRNEHIKVGKTSITVRDESGKTKGIVKNCKAFSTMSPADKFLLHKKNIPLDEVKNCIIQNGTIYYLHNKALANWISQQKRPEIFTNEIEKVERLKKAAEAMRNSGIAVVECIID